MDRRSLAAVVLFALALFIAGGDPGVAVDQPAETRANYLEVTDETVLYPYTTHTPTFAARALAINVIVYGDTREIERHLREKGRADWNETSDETGDIDPVESPINGTYTAWASANGATRYIYFSHPIADFDLWLTESYQLHTGDYYGTRHHIRAYESPITSERWVALQAHREHWDWFRLRHTVDGVQTAQSVVEQEFMDRWFVEDLTRTYVGNTGADMDGWVTIVRIDTRGAPVAVLLAIGVPFVRRLHDETPSLPGVASAREFRMGLLGAALFGLYLFVRFGAIVLERTLSLGDPRLIAIAFYPFIFAGLPITAYWFARTLDQPAAFAAAAVGFTTAILVDYSYLEVAVLPMDTLVHRASLAIALGLIAAGSATAEGHEPPGDRYFRTGILLWLVALGMPLLRFA